MPNGGFSFGDVVDSIGTAISDVVSAILDTLIAIVQFLYAVLVYLFHVLLAVIHFFLSALSKTIAFLRHIHLSGFRNFLSKLLEDYRKLRDILRRHFEPLIQLIQHYRRMLDLIFNRYVRPILQVIQTMRRALLLLRLLHFKFAARLDARLARLEGKITEVFLDLYRNLNRLGNAINLILDPLGLIHPPMLLGSLARSVVGLFHQLRRVREKPLGASELEGQKRDREFGSPRTDREFAEARLAGRSDPWLDDLNASLDREFADLRKGV